MKAIRFYEYSGYVGTDGKISDSISNLPFNKPELDHLRCLSESLAPGKRIFEIGSSRIRANSLVGVMSFAGVQIEILPKLIQFENGNENLASPSIIKNLMFMLSYTNALDVSDSGLGTLSHQYDSFIEAYISIFAQRLSKHLIRFGVPKSYVEKSENINAIRGRIAFGRHSAVNCFDESKVFCEYAEFSEDNPLARAFKFVALNLLHFTKSSSTVASLSRCVGLLDGVIPQYIRPDDLERASIGKRDANLIALINLAKMFLKRMRPDLAGAKSNKVFALIFDMNELFEEFIFQVLKRHSVELDIQVTAQKKKRLVSQERDLGLGEGWQPRSLFDTFTDITIWPTQGRPFIIDTKYKIVGPDKSHYGIGNADAYQVLAYRQIHKESSVEPSVALLYPRSAADIKKEFRVNGSNSTFMAWTIDISRDLKAHMADVVADLRSLIVFGKGEEEDHAA